jgi:hypothetical protein
MTTVVLFAALVVVLGLYLARRRSRMRKDD